MMLLNLNPGFLELSFIGLIVMIFLMTILWILHIPLKNAGIVDIGWGGGLIILSLIYYFLGPGYELRKLLITLMVIIWGSRLTFHLARRVFSESEEDGRYQNMRARWKGNINIKFLYFFEAQGILNVILSFPFLFVALNKSTEIAFIEWLGVLIWLTGLIGETLADKQLRDFKLDPANKGHVCKIKLWSFSRHPNYFFEFLIWIGYSVTALSSPFGWIGVLSPLIILYLLLNVTGVPATEEQALKTKGQEYKNYMETTSKFIPWRRKLK